MLIATIRSRVVTDKRNSEVGYFVTEVEVEMREASASGDPKGFVQHKIAEALAYAVKTTTLPLKEQLWSVEFSKFAQINFNFPEGFIA